MPTNPQLVKLYQIGYTLTNVMFQPIHIIRLDERTKNIFILAGFNEELELQINPKGELINEPY